jgi:tetratricopeptide (TPR) repeat protein
MGRASMRASRRTTSVAALVLCAAAATAAGCDRRGAGDDGRVPPPAPDVAGVEAPLARALAEATAEVDRAPRSAAAWGRLGVLFDIHDFPEEAVACYERAQALDPGEFRWPYFLGITRLIGDRTAAAAAFERAAELEPDYAPIHVYRGRSCLLADDLDRARRAFERAVRLDSTLVRAHLGLGQVALAEGEAERALRHVDRALETGATSGEVHRLRAEALRRRGDRAGAREEGRLGSIGAKFEPIADPVRDALGLTEGVTVRWCKVRADRAMRAEQPVEAADVWRAYLEEVPRSVGARLELAAIYMQVGLADRAMRVLDEAVELAPENARVHFYLGNARAALRDPNPAAAIASFDRALELDPSLARARGNLGVLLVGEGSVDEGLAHIRQAIEAMPGDADLRFNLAMALRGVGRSTEAIAALEDAVTIDPDHVRARFELGGLLAEAGRLDEAAAEFGSVVAAEPTRLGAHVNLVRALKESGRFAGAIEACRRGLERYPEHPHLANYLAWMLATCPVDSLRNGEEAAEIARLWSERSPPSAEFVEILAVAHAERGDFESALRRGREALALVQEQRPDDAASIERIEGELRAFQNGRPFRERSR